MGGNAINMMGQKFGRLTVTSKSASVRCGQLTWNCVCECLTFVPSVLGASLRKGRVRSCGCLLRDITIARCKTHGETQAAERSPEYRAWQGMLERCYKTYSESYPRYGGRGIEVCERWRESYESFLADVGRRPTAKHSIDRYPDNNGDYEPDNCRWATAKEQARNRSNGRFITFAGRLITVAEAAEISGTRHSTILRRLDSGWPDDEAIHGRT